MKVCWLIEAVDRPNGSPKSTPMYFKTGLAKERWTLDPNEALQISEKHVAEAFVRLLNLTYPALHGADWKATEHGFH